MLMHYWNVKMHTTIHVWQSKWLLKIILYNQIMISIFLGEDILVTHAHFVQRVFCTCDGVIQTNAWWLPVLWTKDPDPNNKVTTLVTSVIMLADVTVPWGLCCAVVQTNINSSVASETSFTCKTLGKTKYFRPKYQLLHHTCWNSH